MTIHIIDDQFMVCSDCLYAIVFDDLSPLLQFYSEDEASRREVEIRSGLQRAGGRVELGDADRQEDFSWSPCDCCGSTLGGARHHCRLIGKCIDRA